MRIPTQEEHDRDVRITRILTAIALCATPFVFGVLTFLQFIK